MSHLKHMAALAILLGLVATGCAQKEAAYAGPKNLETIYFDFDKSEIKSAYEPTLADNAAWMKKHSTKDVVIEGHCDERGTAEYNIALGDRRARSAKNYLINLGIDSNRLKTVSYGEERPVATCSTERCWSQNRRAVFDKR